MDDRRNATSWAPALAALAVGYGFFHHVGTVMQPLGEIGQTRWADWIDLLTPYVIVGLAGSVLGLAGASEKQSVSKKHWIVFGLGAVLYVQGHGIHLAANSIGNVAPSDIAHFWDEFVGHYVSYVGLAVLFAVLASVLAGDPVPRHAPLGHGLAVLVGVTHFTNSIEGQFALPGLAIAAGFAAWGWCRRTRAGVFLLTAFGLAVILFATFGIWHHGFPEFSELGWT